MTVNDLNLRDDDDTAVVSITVSIACGVDEVATWTTVGHNTSSFTNPYAKTIALDPASQLDTTVTPCSAASALAFIDGPTDAEAGTTITSQPGVPRAHQSRSSCSTGTASRIDIADVTVSLAIVEGTGSSGAVLTGSTSQTDASGQASFSQLAIDTPGLVYQLRATATGLEPATSGPFDIHAVLVECDGFCSATESEGNTTASVSANSAGGYVAMSFGVEALSCDDAANQYYPRTSEVLTFEVTGSSAQIVTMTIAKSSVTRPFYRYRACFSSPTNGFVNHYGVAIAPGQAGLLPDCFDFHHHGSSARALTNHGDVDAPCQLLRGVDRHGNVFVTFLTAEDDPEGSHLGVRRGARLSQLRRGEPRAIQTVRLLWHVTGARASGGGSAARPSPSSSRT